MQENGQKGEVWALGASRANAQMPECKATSQSFSLTLYHGAWGGMGIKRTD